MTATEVQNFQEAFVIANGFAIELSLALLLVLAVFIAVLWLFDLPRKRNS
jgi:hypothetical protein